MKDDEIQILIDVFNSLNDLSLKNQRDILNELNKCLAECTQDIYDFKIKFEDAELFEKLMFQIIYHNSSLEKLSDGSIINIREQSLKINDLSAIYSLARLQLETFINLSYNFFIDCKYSKKLRIYVYKIQGLRKQISLSEKHRKDFPPVLKMRKELAEEIFKLRKLNEYGKLSYKEREKLIRPNHAKLLKPEEIYKLIEIRDLSKSHSLYSNHIHAEYIGIRQLRSSIKDITNFENSSSTVFLIFNTITCSVIKNLTDLYLPDGNSYSKVNLKLRKLIEMTNSISKKA
ncbi:MAG: hypothetical protein V7655_12295 [Aequorivita antarctica]